MCYQKQAPHGETEEKHMTYHLYQTDDGMIKVYEETKNKYYLDIDNRYDMEFKTKREYAAYMKSVNAVFFGIDED